MILDLQDKTQNSFQTIKEILDFATRARVPISEDHVKQNITFFKSLLD
jgi:hypothetical protein